MLLLILFCCVSRKLALEKETNARSVSHQVHLADLAISGCLAIHYITPGGTGLAAPFHPTPPASMLGLSATAYPTVPCVSTARLLLQSCGSRTSRLTCPWRTRAACSSTDAAPSGFSGDRVPFANDGSGRPTRATDPEDQRLSCGRFAKVKGNRPKPAQTMQVRIGVPGGASSMPRGSTRPRRNEATRACEAGRIALSCQTKTKEKMAAWLVKLLPVAGWFLSETFGSSLSGKRGQYRGPLADAGSERVMVCVYD